MRDLLVHLGEVLLTDRIGDCELPGLVGDDVVVKKRLALLGGIE